MKKKPKQLAVRDTKNLQLLWKQMESGKLPLSKTFATYGVAFKR